MNISCLLLLFSSCILFCPPPQSLKGHLWFYLSVLSARINTHWKYAPLSFYYCEKNKPFVYIHSKFQSTARGFYGNIQYTYHSLILNQVRQGFPEMGLSASLPCSCLFGSHYLAKDTEGPPAICRSQFKTCFFPCFASSLSLNTSWSSYFKPGATSLNQLI